MAFSPVSVKEQRDRNERGGVLHDWAVGVYDAGRLRVWLLTRTTWGCAHEQGGSAFSKDAMKQALSLHCSHDEQERRYRMADLKC